MHAALSLFDEKFLWDELRFRLTPAEILKLEAANQFYDYEQSVTRRYIKYALNFILDAKRSKIFLEDMVYSRFGSKKHLSTTCILALMNFEKCSKRACRWAFIACTIFRLTATRAFTTICGTIDDTKSFWLKRIDCKLIENDMVGKVVKSAHYSRPVDRKE